MHRPIFSSANGPKGPKLTEHELPYLHACLNCRVVLLHCSESKFAARAAQAELPRVLVPASAHAHTLTYSSFFPLHSRFAGVCALSVQIPTPISWSESHALIWSSRSPEVSSAKRPQRSGSRQGERRLRNGRITVAAAMGSLPLLFGFNRT